MNKKNLLNFFQIITRYIFSNHVILFFISTSFIKLYIISTHIIDVRWSWAYENSIICSFFCTVVLFLPVLFLNKNKTKVSIVIASLLSLLLFVDVFYYSYYSSIPSIGLIGLLGLTGDVGPAITELIKPSYFLFFIDILVFAIFSKSLQKTADKFSKQGVPQKTKKQTIQKIYTSTTFITLLVLSLLMSGVKTLGDVYERSYDNVSTMQYYGLIATHAIDIIRFIDQETSNLSKEEKIELYDWVSKHKPEQVTSSLNGIAKNKNIILIQVESLGSTPIEQTVNGQEITPNLNDLINSSHYFPDNRYTIGGGHSSDSDLVVNTSYIPLDNAATLIRFKLDDVISLPKILKKEGYSTNAYHGFVSNFWSRDIAYKSFGYDKFYSSSDYSDGKKINMGLNDGDFLSETADYLTTKKQPSFSSIITLSSHVPFGITELTKQLGLSPSDYPSQVAGYLENINYVDRMLGEFFEKLKQNQLYEDSLIIVFGDHAPVLPSFQAGSISFDNSSIEALESPIFIKLPNQKSGKTYQNIGTNLDIMPTVLDLLGINTDQLMFGQSLFAQVENNIAICPNQMILFKEIENCDTAITTQKNISEKIIRYNQFDILNDPIVTK